MLGFKVQGKVLHFWPSLELRAVLSTGLEGHLLNFLQAEIKLKSFELCPTYFLFIVGRHGMVR